MCIVCRIWTGWNSSNYSQLEPIKFAIYRDASSPVNGSNLVKRIKGGGIRCLDLPLIKYLIPYLSSPWSKYPLNREMTTNFPLTTESLGLLVSLLPVSKRKMLEIQKKKFNRYIDRYFINLSIYYSKREVINWFFYPRIQKFEIPRRYSSECLKLFYLRNSGQPRSPSALSLSQQPSNSVVLSRV